MTSSRGGGRHLQTAVAAPDAGAVWSSRSAVIDSVCYRWGDRPAHAVRTEHDEEHYRWSWTTIRTRSGSRAAAQACRWDEMGHGEADIDLERRIRRWLARWKRALGSWRRAVGRCEAHAAACAARARRDRGVVASRTRRTCVGRSGTRSRRRSTSDAVAVCVRGALGLRGGAPWRGGDSCTTSDAQRGSAGQAVPRRRRGDCPRGGRCARSRCPRGGRLQGGMGRAAPARASAPTREGGGRGAQVRRLAYGLLR